MVTSTRTSRTIRPPGSTRRCPILRACCEYHLDERTNERALNDDEHVRELTFGAESGGGPFVWLGCHRGRVFGRIDSSRALEEQLDWIALYSRERAIPYKTPFCHIASI